MNLFGRYENHQEGGPATCDSQQSSPPTAEQSERGLTHETVLVLPPWTSTARRAPTLESFRANRSLPGSNPSEA